MKNNISKNNRVSGLSKGFTLIELLVVIAIIAILAAIILANLSESRKKGNDAGVKANMANIQTESEVYFDQHGNAYGINSSLVTSCNNSNTFFKGDSAVSTALAQVTANAAGAPTCRVATRGKAWALSAPLKSGGAKPWCVDSYGFAGYGTVQGASDDDAKCA